jgi:hypothetical protein
MAKQYLHGPQVSCCLVDERSLGSAQRMGANAYFGRAPAIIKQRERIKQQTIEHRRLQHRKLAA